MAPFKVVPLCHHARVAGWEAVSRCVIADWNQQERAVMYLVKSWHLAAVIEIGSAQSAAWYSLLLRCLRLLQWEPIDHSESSVADRCVMLPPHSCLSLNILKIGYYDGHLLTTRL